MRSIHHRFLLLLLVILQTFAMTYTPLFPFFRTEIAMASAATTDGLYPNENRLVKSPTDSTVYLLQREGLRAVPVSLLPIWYGVNYLSKVTVLNGTFFKTLKIGPPFDGASVPTPANPEQQTTVAISTPVPASCVNPAADLIRSMTKAVLVKVASVAKVYLVYSGQIHWIPSEAAASDYFGSSWSKKITVISASALARYRACAALADVTARASVAVPQQTTPTPAASSPPTAAPALPTEPLTVPVSDHPRIWINSSDLNRLRGWATSDNPVYANGVLPAIKNAVTIYQTKFFPGGIENPTWPEPGNITWQSPTTEAVAQILAFASLIDPDPTARRSYAGMSRNILMHVMTEAAKGFAPRVNGVEVSFRDAQFGTYDRARVYGDAFGTTVDWLQATPNVLSSTDKETIRKVFLLWSEQIRENGRAAPPRNKNNDPSLIANTKALRWAGNNYYSGQVRNLTLMALSLDPSDDPNGTLRGYLNDVIGTYLYQQYALYDHGDASGGTAPEGSLYGDSFGFIYQGLLALRTSGFSDPAVYGKQITLIDSPMWDQYIDGFFNSITPQSMVPKSQPYLGNIYQVAGYGDMLRSWVTPDYMSLFGPIGLRYASKGNAEGVNKIRWLSRNVLEGGATKMMERIKGTSYGANEPIFYFLTFDPKATMEKDPRPALPLSFMAPTQGRLLARTDWSPNASWFSYLCNWITIDHQHGACNEFGLFRKGEWLTKEHSNYDNNEIGELTDYHNTLSLQNTVPTNLQWFESKISARGSQWEQGLAVGDPTTRMSVGTGYAYAFGDATNLYNRSNSTATDITHASRSIVWLQPDIVVTYDRATSNKQNEFKRFNLNLVSSPTITGHTAVAKTAGGQQLFIETLLPVSATLTTSLAEAMRPVAELEPTTHRLVVEDPTNPKDVRFLHVLHGTDAGASKIATQLVRSTAGTSSEGVQLGTSTVVLFPVDVTVPFTSVTYRVAKTVTRHFFTGMKPGAGYDIAFKDLAGGEQEVTITSGSHANADQAGLLAF